MDIYPLAPLIFAVFFAYLAAKVYRKMIPYDAVKTAVDFIAQYRVLERTAKSKRDIKKLRTMEPEYKKARRVILRTTIVKFVVLTSMYISGGIATALVAPLIESPFYFPLFTLPTEDGRLLMQSFFIYFMIFIYVSLVYREYLL
ncbi:MAG: hypothetical protein GSR85_06875 [Desulfurococcales archaeon]|nr:hypothetical protein [Desulfurococcales archaeon]